jgi:hypothetical protein
MASKLILRISERLAAAGRSAVSALSPSLATVAAVRPAGASTLARRVLASHPGEEGVEAQLPQAPPFEAPRAAAATTPLAVGAC